MNSETCGAGLSSRLVRSREFRATDTEMTSTFVHSIEKKINNWHGLKVSNSFSKYELTDNYQWSIMNFTYISWHIQIWRFKWLYGVWRLWTLQEKIHSSAKVAIFIHYHLCEPSVRFARSHGRWERANWTLGSRRWYITCMESQRKHMHLRIRYIVIVNWFHSTLTAQGRLRNSRAFCVPM